GLDHVADEGVVAAALRGHASVEAAIAVALGDLRAPLVEGEWWIRHDDVEAHEPVALDEPGRADRVAPFDPRLVESVEKHVHLGEGPGRAVQLLAEEGHVPDPAGPFGHRLAGADEERAGAAAGVADPLARVRFEDPGEES